METSSLKMDRLIEHSCRRVIEKLMCRTLIETNIFGEPKYRYKKGNKCPNIERFQNRMFLSEIEIQESQRKRKRNTLSPRRKKENIS